MSRHWSEYEYVSADLLWSMIETWMLRLSSEDCDQSDSELYKLFLAGKKEGIDLIADFLSENQVRLGAIVENRGVLSKEEVDLSIRKIYGE